MKETVRGHYCLNVDSMKALAETKREIIFSELITSHLKPLTVKDIIDNTHIAVSTVRKALKEFEHNNFIIPIH